MASQTQTAFPPYVLAALGPFVGFLLGFIAFSINEARKTRKDRYALCNLFLDHIAASFSQVDALLTAPVGPYASRFKLSALGVATAGFSGTPEYQFEVDDISLFRAHGVALARVVGTTTRAQFWIAYRHLRNAEAVRKVLQPMPTTDPDRATYQELFLNFIKAYNTSLRDLNGLLEKEVSFLKGLV